MSSSVSGAGYRQTVNLGDALDLTEGDLLLILQEQRSRILERTARGVDYQGSPFAPYNTTRPFYWYPSGPVGKQRSAAELQREKNNVKRAGRSAGLSFRTPEDRKQNLSRSGLGIKFKSYADFKRSLGRGTVDLYGPRAPHMLQSMTIQAGSLSESAVSSITDAADVASNPATEATLGIYGEAGARASGHNSADRPRGMPLRRFFAVSDQDEQQMAKTVGDRIAKRLAKAIDDGWKHDFDLGF